MWVRVKQEEDGGEVGVAETEEDGSEVEELTGVAETEEDGSKAGELTGVAK